MGCGLSGRLNPRGCGSCGRSCADGGGRGYEAGYVVARIVLVPLSELLLPGRGRASKRATSAWSSAMVARARSNPACVSTATTSRMSAIPAYPAPPSLP